jgi:arsenate reductase
MARAFVQKYAGDRFEVHAAGLDPKGISPYAIKVMDEVGIDLNGQESKSVKEFLGQKHFTYLFTVCHHAEQNCPVSFLTTGIHNHWHFEDPNKFEGTDEEKIEMFRSVRNQIDSRIREWLEDVGI